MKNKIIPLLVVGTALISACNQQAGTSTAPAVAKEDAIAEVNGVYIAKATLTELEKEIAERSHGQKFPKEKLVEELIQRELLVQDANKKQLGNSAEIIAQLDSAKKSLLTQADVQNFIKSNPVTDAEIKTEYDAKVAGENGTEYKARHILVKTEDEAKKIIAELDKGGDFAKIANKVSLDGKDTQNGGDLGWFVASQMVAPFSDAVIKLDKGQYTKSPVQTQFGWHVILREDSRAQTPPSLDSVKEQLLPYLQRKKVQDFVEGLRKSAKVEILLPKEEPAKASEPATKGDTVTEEVAVGEVKDKDGKVVAEEVVVDEVVKDKDGKVVAEKVEVEKVAEPAKK